MKKTITKIDSFKYGGLEIEKINSTDPLVPTTALEVTLEKGDEKALAIALKTNLPALLIGETGTGKTSVVKQLAFLRQQAYVRVNMTGFTTPDELIGSKSVKEGATYYEKGIITDAMMRGAVLVLDEINATSPDCLFILHGLLDEDRRVTLPNGDVIRPHDNFRVFATANPDYEGTKSMNKAFIDRFPIILMINVLDPKKEEELLIARTGIDPTLATDLVTIGTMARKSYEDNKIGTFVSTRSLLSIGNLVKEGMTPIEAYTTTIIRKTSNKEEQTILRDFFMAIMKIGQMEGDNPDKPVIITQRELKDLKTQHKNAVNQMTKFRDEATIAKSEALGHKTLKEDLERKNRDLQATIEVRDRTIKSQIKNIEQYQELDKLVKHLSGKDLAKIATPEDVAEEVATEILTEEEKANIPF